MCELHVSLSSNLTASCLASYVKSRVPENKGQLGRGLGELTTYIAISHQCSFQSITETDHVASYYKVELAKFCLTSKLLNFITVVLQAYIGAKEEYTSIQRGDCKRSPK